MEVKDKTSLTALNGALLEPKNDTNISPLADAEVFKVRISVVTEVGEADFDQARKTFEACKRAGLPGEELVTNALAQGHDYPLQRLQSVQSFSSEELQRRAREVWISAGAEATGSYGVYQTGEEQLLTSGEQFLPSGEGSSENLLPPGSSVVKFEEIQKEVIRAEGRVVELGVVVKRKVQLLNPSNFKLLDE